MQVALKKLRQWSRTGFSEELDINDTISYTAKNGFLDVKTRPEKENSIKILLTYGLTNFQHFVKR